jgi:hypothetical protein
MSDIGRNDPCYCGSGKKYKQCHMRADKEAERERRAWKEAARFLRRDLIAFAQEEQFAAAFAESLPVYWNGLYELSNADQMSEPEALRFFDWFLFDYEQPDGRRLIDIYAEENIADLSTHQQQMLAGWRETAVTGLYELLSYEGQTLQFRDYMTGETYEVYEPSGRGAVEIGELVIARLVPIEDRLEMSTTAAYLPAAEITDVAEKLAAAKAAYLETHPDADQQTFMRRHNHLIIHHALAEAENQGRPPVAALDHTRPDAKQQKLANRLKAKFQ